jgi:hypothetical protein
MNFLKLMAYTKLQIQETQTSSSININKYMAKHIKLTLHKDKEKITKAARGKS